MAMKKKMLLHLVLLTITLVITGCAAKQKPIDLDEGPLPITIVTEVPAGYSSMREISKRYAGIISFGELEGSLFHAVDVEDNYIWRARADEKEKIVMYEDDYYIRDSEIEAIIDEAKRTAEQKEWNYEIGDCVELFGSKEDIYITVEKLQYYTKDTTNQTRCRVLFSFEFTDPGEFIAADCLYSLEFSDGSTGREIIRIDMNTIDVAVPENCHICKITLCSPENNAMQRTVSCCTDEECLR